ncbi:MAG: ABC transporter ATP-binding protein [Candidatus Zixiibacteriota bacterium]|nr:MAG: ABC transporter ATP-binding protein [candidate division Zixibacteria bacterium]
MKKEASGIIKSYILRHKRAWVRGIPAVILTTIFTMAVPWILRHVINILKGDGSTKKLILYAGAIIAATIIQGIFRYMMRQTMIVASWDIEYEIRNDLFSHLLKLDRRYFDSTPTGDIMARITNDLESVRAMVGPGIMHFIFTAFTFLTAMVLMLVINLKLTLIALLPLPLITGFTYLISKEVHNKYSKIQEHFSKITAEVQENLSGIRVIKAYVQEGNAVKRFGRLSQEYIRKNMNMIRIWGLFFPVILGFTGIAIMLVLWIGGNMVINNVITLGDLVAFTAYLMLLTWPMAALGWVIGLYQRGMASMKRIAQIFNTKPVIISPPSGGIKKEIQGKIEFKKLRFSYNGNYVLNDINLTIQPGQTVAILGHTGCGKSSLISLIPRLYQVKSEMLYIDDIDVNDYNLECLRSQIGLVAQETFLFSRSIESNIAFGDKVSEGTIKKTASIAAIDEDIGAFPSGYNTILGERGITLSGGQKQRTALARALAIKPKILILDDAFSSVDTSTEENILKNLKQVFSKCTTLIISHRISSIKNSDFIVVLKNGQIAETGTHDELITAGGLYTLLYKRQLLKQELETL